MTTVPEVVLEIIKKSPYIEYGISQGLINLSSYARKIKPEIDEILMKDVTEGSIVMALKRLTPSVRNKQISVKLSKLIKDIIVRSNLVEFTFSNSKSLIKKHIELLDIISKRDNTFFTLCEGTFETTIIISAVLEKEVEKLFSKENRTMKLQNLSAITLKLTDENIDIPGLHYTVFKLLAWDGVNVRESISTYTELTIVLDDILIDKAFSTLRKAINS